MVPVHCENCSNFFEVEDSLVGGLANCPACGKATTVPGLNDPWFRMAQVVMAVVWALVTAWAFTLGGMGPALIVGAVAALIIVVLHWAM
jgi:hypothetical protein